jgi:beta-lactamase superfamily II metal-dependent hydrolase
MAPKAPKKVVVRAYQVGFGDCLLLTFEYDAKDKRHMLIDFGTVAWGNPRIGNKQVADSIVQETGGKLSVVVVSHRHTDHISGLVRAWDTLKDLNPDLVVEPWTESPDHSVSSKERPALYVAAMKHAHAVCALAAAEVKGMGADASARAAAGIGLLAAAAADTKLAAELDQCLSQWGGPEGKNRRFVAKGDALELSAVLPGVKATVLGPPAKLRKTGRLTSEWWPMAHAALKAPRSPKRLFPEAPVYRQGEEPAETRWFRRRLVRARSEQLFELVSLANEEVNNTSVILLLEVGGKKLLFPGDAEGEGWQEALESKKDLKLLSDVTVYKVGHHGSRNATPLTLWNNFKKRGRGLEAILSSKHTSKYADVPRPTLLEALEGETELVTTIGGELTFTATETQVG